jgi:hypothetical protein
MATHRRAPSLAATLAHERPATSQRGNIAAILQAGDLGIRLLHAHLLVEQADAAQELAAVAGLFQDWPPPPPPPTAQPHPTTANPHEGPLRRPGGPGGQAGAYPGAWPVACVADMG